MSDTKRYFMDHGMWHDRKTGRHLEDIAKERDDPSERALHLLNVLSDYDQTDEEARAELEADGVDVEAFLRKVHADVEQAKAAATELRRREEEQ